MTLIEVSDAGQRTPPPEFDRLKEANHRIANHLTVIVGMVQLQAAKVAKGPRTLTRDETAAILRDAANKIIMVGNLHRRLAAQPTSDAVDLADFLIESCTHLVESLSDAQLHLVQRLGADCRTTPEQAQQLGLVGEIMMNAAKHAHPTGLPVQISVGCHLGRDARILLSIADDGVGLPEGFDLEGSGGTGFKVIRSIARSLNADLEIESTSLGLCFRLLLPPNIKSKQLSVVTAE